MAQQPLSNRRLSSSPLSVIVGFTAILLTLTFVVLTMSTLAGLQLGTTLLHPSPFVAYEAVWPGQSVASVAAFAQRTPQGVMLCVSGTSPREPYTGLEVRVAAGAYDALRQKLACTHSPKDGVFRLMTIAIDHGQVHELELFSDVLRQESLLLYWGTPDSITRTASGQLLLLCWERNAYSATASVLESNSVVKMLTLTATE